MSWTDVSKFGFEDRMLWMCVLRRSVFDYVLYKGSGKHKLKFQRACRFIFERDDGDGLTFEQICGLFGWEPGYLQRMTKQLTRADIKKLEAMKFKDDFDDTPISTLALSAKWETGTVVPFFAPYNYNEEVRDRLRMRPVVRRQRLRSLLAPMVRWSAV